MKNKAAQSKAWKTVQIARHPERPQFLDYVGEIFTEFDALHGDRVFGDDGAMIGGLARFNGQPVMVVGQHRGRSTRENCNIISGCAILKAIASHNVYSIWQSDSICQYLRLLTLWAHTQV